MIDYETRDYEVTQIKKGDFQDNFGNYYCDMALKGIGEPVKIAVKDPTKLHDGMTLYGTIETKDSRAGKPYLKFKRMEKEDASSGTTQPKSVWQPESPERQNSINRSVSLNNAAAVFQGTGVEADQVTAYADVFYTWLSKGNTAEQIFDVDPGQTVNLDDIPY